MSSQTLRDRARNATLIARSATEEQGQQLLAGRADELADQISVAAVSARELSAALRESGLKSGKTIPTARQAVAKAARTFLTEPVNTNLEKARESLRFLQSAIDEASRQLHESWTQHRQANPAPSLDRSYLEQLASAGFDVSAIEARVEKHDARLMILATRTVPRKGDLEAWDIAVGELRQAADDLAGLAPPEVRSFLSQAVGTGASIDMLTPAVQRFLTDRGLAASFKIVRR